MKIAVLILVASFPICQQIALAQELTWHEGSVVLTSRDVLTGEMTLDESQTIILFRSDSSSNAQVLSAHKIETVQFYDVGQNINRRFLSLSESNGVWRRATLYEVVLNGKLPVLRKQRAWSAGLDPQHADFDYYIHYNNKLLSLQAFRRKIFPMLKRSEVLVDDFIRDNRLNPNRIADAIRILQYYNRSVTNDSMLVAMH